MNSATLSATLNRALRFSQNAHESIGQRRKDGGPYFEHPLAVAGKVREVGGDESMMIAALFHDILEDVYPVNKEFSPDRISKEFGATVLGIVFELTDVFTKEAFPQYNRAERKRQEAFRLASVSDAAKIIKTADLWHNGLTLDNLGGFGGVWAEEKRFLIPLLLPVEDRWQDPYKRILKEINL